MMYFSVFAYFSMQKSFNCQLRYFYWSFNFEKSGVLLMFTSQRELFSSYAAPNTISVWNPCSRSAVSNTWPARGSNAARKHQEKWRYWINCSISQKDWVLTQLFSLIFIMRPARPCFQAPAARETLWVWDPCSRS